LAWFRNDYKDKIAAGDEVLATATTTSGVNWNVLRWENIPEALIQGFEGSIGMEWDGIKLNIAKRNQIKMKP